MSCPVSRHFQQLFRLCGGRAPMLSMRSLSAQYRYVESGCKNLLMSAHIISEKAVAAPSFSEVWREIHQNGRGRDSVSISHESAPDLPLFAFCIPGLVCELKSPWSAKGGHSNMFSYAPARMAFNGDDCRRSCVSQECPPQAQEHFGI